jgi:hypothetical protein
MCAREQCTYEQYDATSQEPETSWQHLYFTFGEAKQRLAKELLAKLVPAIESFVSRQ